MAKNIITPKKQPDIAELAEENANLELVEDIPIVNDTDIFAAGGAARGGSAAARASRLDAASSETQGSAFGNSLYLSLKKYKKLFAFFICLCGIVILFSFGSFVFSWWVDYDIFRTTSIREILSNKQLEIKNWGGKLGGYLSYFFIYRAFGVSAILIPISIILLGIYKLGVLNVRWKKLAFYSFFAVVFSCLFFGSIPFLQNNRFSILGGEMGYEVSLYLKSVFGSLAFYTFLIFAVFSLLFVRAIRHGKEARVLSFGARRKSGRSDGLRAEPSAASLGDYDRFGEADGLDDGASFDDTESEDFGGQTLSQNLLDDNILDFQKIEEEVGREFGGDYIDGMLGSGDDMISEQEFAAATALVSTQVGVFVENAALTSSQFGSDNLGSTQVPTAFASSNLGSAQIGSDLENKQFGSNLQNENLSREIPLNINPIPPQKDENGIEFVVETPKETVALNVENLVVAKEENFGIDSPYDYKYPLNNYRYPTVDLLEDYGNKLPEISAEELEANKDRIISTLRNFGIEISKITAITGPTVTLYEIVPEAGTKISKIQSLEKDIALNLEALGIRIIAPIPGKGTIGIEVPNAKKRMVPMREMLVSDKFINGKFELPIAIGKTISNEVFVTDLASMPHLLVAGATGQGKSVGLNAIIASLLYKKHPAELKFVMIDPKRVELSLFNCIENHFLAKLPESDEAVITDTQKALQTLNSLCVEMDSRYDLLKSAGVRKITEYNRKFLSRRLNPEDGHKYLPYIVLIVDEFADLILTAGKEVETPIQRLAQLARAVGIHLIIATQRPSVNVITGAIKANFPARMAFRVSSPIDSQTILGTTGANQLIGKGDMLISLDNEIVRLQCPFIDTPEVERICQFIEDQASYPHAFILPEYKEVSSSSDRFSGDRGAIDRMFHEIARHVVKNNKCTVSDVQRRFELGFQRAARIVDQLEDYGIVRTDGREKKILVSLSELDELLDNIK